MDRIRLGRTDLTVSRLCLGTMTFGLQTDETVARQILDVAGDAGITFIDSADVYPLGGDLTTTGQTEEILGRWLAGRRDEFVIATKFGGATGPGPEDRGGSRKHILEAVDASLRRLRTDYIDLYQMHSFDPATGIDETIETLDHLVTSGRVRYVGCSNFLAYQVARAIGRAEVGNRVRFDTVQPRYNLLFRQIERELLPLCGEEQIGVLPYNPLAGGLLTGKHRADAVVPGSRFTLGEAGERYRQRYWHAAELETVLALSSLAEEAGVPLATLALQWVLARPEVTAPIIGASRPSQLVDLLAAERRPIDPALRSRLDELTRTFRHGDAPR